MSPPDALSPIGKKFQIEDEIPLLAKSNGPKSNALARVERALST